jgi:acetyl esterase/lipase
LLRIAIQVLSLIKPQVPLVNLPREQGDRFEVLETASEASYTGILKIDEEISPRPTGITWYPSRPTTSSELRSVVLHFHGGAYVFGDGRDNDAGPAARSLLEAGKGLITHVVCPQYRLASTVGGRFPAALQDAVTCYYHLVTRLQVDPKDIIVSGDSAGGNLVLALLRYTETSALKHHLKPPANVWLWSPWVDPMIALEDDFAHDRSDNAKTDYTTGGLGAWSAKEFAPAPSTGKDLTCEYIQSLGNPFATKASLFFCMGGVEVFLADNAKLARQFALIPGNKVRVHIIEGAPTT